MSDLFKIKIKGVGSIFTINKSDTFFLLVAVLALLELASPPAVVQEPEAPIKLNGEWRFEEAIVNVVHDGNTVRAEFIEGAECFDGQVRPYLLSSGDS